MIFPLYFLRGRFPESRPLIRETPVPPAEYALPDIKDFPRIVISLKEPPPMPRNRWYIRCIEGADGAFAAHVIRCRRVATGLAPYGFWVPEADTSHRDWGEIWEPGRYYRNKKACDRAIRQLVARFPGIRLEVTHLDRRRRWERVWTVGANPYRK